MARDNIVSHGQYPSASRGGSSSGIMIPITSSMPPPPSFTAEQRHSSRIAKKWAVSASNGVPSLSISQTSSSQQLLTPSQTSSQQLGKRKRGRPTKLSSSSDSFASRFPEHVKQQIRQASSGWKCWHCGAGDTDVAHVLPAQSRSLLTLLSQSGLTNVEHVNQMHNGLPLCPTCHRTYDRPGLPSWVFYPEDLKFFIREEKKDMKRRVQMWKNTKGKGEPAPRRIPPTSAAYSSYQKRTRIPQPEDKGGFYSIFVVSEFGPEGREFQKGQSIAKPWHGDPMIALNHAFTTIIYGFVEIPEDLRSLNELYRANDIKVNRMAATSTASDDGDDDDDGEDEEDDDEDDAARDGKERDNEGLPADDHHGNAGPSTRRRSRRLERRGQAGGGGMQERSLGRTDDVLVMLSSSSRKPVVVMQEEMFAQSVPCKRRRMEEDADWELGPQATAQHAIDFFSFFNGAGYRDDGPWAEPVPTVKHKETTTINHGLLSPGES
ncbi:MAG: hypothetical protein Q9210_001156 [Variospora velana]